MSNFSTPSCSSSPTPSDSTAPLLVSEDFQSLSSDETTSASTGTGSDWSTSSSDNGHDDDEDQDEEDNGFDMLASQVQSEISSNASASSSSGGGGGGGGGRMTLSFPDPISTSTTTSDDHHDSNASCSNKVEQDLDNSILVDGGSYSLLLDAPSSSSSSVTPTLESPRRRLKKEEQDFTSTPPPFQSETSSLRPVYSRAYPSSSTTISNPSSSSSIVRVSSSSSTNGKRQTLSTSTSSSNKKNACREKDKIDKWRSQLSSASLSSNPINSIDRSSQRGGGEGGESIPDLLSFSSSSDSKSSSSSNTVTPLARSVQTSINTNTPAIREEEEVDKSMSDERFEKLLDDGGYKLEGQEREEPGSSLTTTTTTEKRIEALDRISGQGGKGGKVGSRVGTTTDWSSRIMVGLTMMGIVLAFIGGGLKVWNKNEGGVMKKEFKEMKNVVETRLHHAGRGGEEQENLLVDDNSLNKEVDKVLQSPSSFGQSSITASAVNPNKPSLSLAISSTLYHALSTATPPVSPSTSITSSPSQGQGHHSKPLIASNSIPSPTNLVDSSLPPFASPSSSIHRIDPPFSIISATTSTSPSSPLDEEEEEEEGEIILSLKERMCQHALKCRQQQQQGREGGKGLTRTKFVRQVTKLSRKGVKKIRKKISSAQNYGVMSKNSVEGVINDDDDDVDSYNRAMVGGRKKKRKFVKMMMKNQLVQKVYKVPPPPQRQEGEETLVDHFKEVIQGGMNLFSEFEKKLEREIMETFINKKKTVVVGRLERYPIVRDYYRSTKQGIKDRLPSSLFRGGGGGGKKHKISIEKIKAEIFIKSNEMFTSLKDRARFTQEEVERFKKGLIRRGEKHLRRAARTVRTIEKKGIWEVRREIKRNKREFKRKEKQLDKMKRSSNRT